MKLTKGYVQLYTGEGKGKTTAAFGLALRALGVGMKVFIAQFLKSGDSGALKAFKSFGDSVVFVQYGSGSFICKKTRVEDKRLARLGLENARQAMISGEFDLIILDEATWASFLQLFSVQDLLEFIQQKPESVELVITGRKADPRLIEAADLVTEMREVKHYFKKGIMARKGIEL